MASNPKTITTQGWRCVYCDCLFPHTKSAAEHFDECEALKKKLIDLENK